MIVPASGSVLTDLDRAAMHLAIDRGWLTAGPVNAEFETALSAFTGIRHVRTCNSGSSANLLAVAAMVESGRWKRGDHVLTVAASFPTTVNPLLMYGLVPRFVDVGIGTYNADVGQLHRAAGGHRVKGIMLAHTLGNPFDIAAVQEICRSRGLFLIEDCCDALGATVELNPLFFSGTRHVGNFGSIATCSFFPAHHITTGEGGAVFTNDDELAALVTSVRDWGRDCWCAPGANDTCGMRFTQQHGEMPYGYDHKSICRTLGFNLKGTEVGAACGLSQAGRLPAIVAARRRHFDFLRAACACLGDHVTLPRFEQGASPFGFPITIKETGLRRDLQAYLAQEGVDSRVLFAGNLTKQPYMRGREWLVHGELRNTDKIMDDCLWIGCHPELTGEQLEYSAAKVCAFFGVFE